MGKKNRTPSITLSIPKYENGPRKNSIYFATVFRKLSTILFMPATYSIAFGVPTLILRPSLIRSYVSIWIIGVTNRDKNDFKEQRKESNVLISVKQKQKEQKKKSKNKESIIKVSCHQKHVFLT